mmetsp:Transcript_12143/g.38654  ORF Transcript_12143/g.38654 Transcript_12143/m.38654 type:complete len:286 (+) Transcript_12143:754-1611(+)
MASQTDSSCRVMTRVSTGLLPSGGVSREDMSRMPDMHMYMVRGMGVAESESTSMPRAACFIWSFCRTPNRCSSSTTSKPSLPQRILGERRAWVPTRMWTAPSATSSSRACRSLADLLTSVESISTRTVCGMRRRRTRRCWAASTVVGERKATCLPFETARYAARIAASVLPKPTSPQTRRSIGRSDETMSRWTSAKQESWSAVGEKGKPASKSAMRGPSGAQGGRVRDCRSAYIATRSEATPSTSLSARALRLTHDLRERVVSSLTGSYSSTSSRRLKSLISWRR